MLVMRVVFLGSPEFAVPALRALIAGHDVVGVVCQPDRPAGRGRQTRPPPVKIAAAALGLPVYQPERLADPVSEDTLRAWLPDVILVAAYGQILRPAILAIPPLGCLNLHASLLPRWRGASPIQHALLAGDPMTGVTVMKMDSGLDTGPILAQQEVPVEPGDTAGSLSARLANVGASLLVETLPAYSAGRLPLRPQASDLATFAPRLTRAAGALDPAQPAENLARMVRAFDPWPGTRLSWKHRPLAVLKAHAAEAAPHTPGAALVINRSPAIATGDGVLVLDRVQLPGGRPVDGAAFLDGHRDFPGSILTAA
jgi:methionyl-tRNA formyltransferase